MVRWKVKELSGCDQDLLPCGLQSDDHSGGEADLICLFSWAGHFLEI